MNTTDQGNEPTSNGRDQPESADLPPPTETPTADEIAKLRQEAAELKDKYLRVYADMENMRRRQERDRVDLIKYSLESAFKDFLPVLDSLERALPDDDTAAPKANGSGADRSHYEGMMMVKRQLLDAFKKHGLEAINAAGSPFDPNLHQAIQRLESKDVTAETVGNEFARGYQLNGRLLRPAMVSVLIPTGGE